MRGLAFGVIVACLGLVPAAAEESAAEVIRSFGLIGTWSVDCKRDPNQVCTNNGCGARLTYVVPFSGPPTIRNVIGTFSPGQVRTFVSTIYSATRVADDKIKIVSVQDPPPSTTLVWWRQPGEVWEIVLLKVGDKYRTFSAHREDRKKIDVEEGFEVRPPPPPPPAKAYDVLLTQWVRTQRQMPLFEKCSDQ
ncbi:MULTISPECIES: hypothetical protein [unclassified Bradyrhizobium]|uniref:hypothetical protein n=1 Tax=unclassified Bradyrhizobium TaxID=2631580 RepID=UPI0024798A86|nr:MULTISPECIES: hypothetical protein [unclassified Bradyrhizobium]WGR72541.1 hypothetical protein MTX24_06280 [Bradyrhizobium sp. ISRA426]WGR77374.1 hypothetical protein MTX21_31230 [Bradyrhizobium sp. ISRA430]WGR87780.1 hypothetical protein MTX25_06280 [Bradyrhizobium sp. ISRA432]